MLDRKLSGQDSEPPTRQPFVTIDDCIQSAEELLGRLSQLGEQKHPLDVRKGVRAPVTNNQSNRMLKASSKTYFFDVKTDQAGGKCLVVTESHIKDK